MRQFTIGVLWCAAFLASAACSKNEAENAENASTNLESASAAADDLYSIKAGTITGNRNPGINSSFKIKRDKAGIASNLYGGACIIFRASDLEYKVKNPVCQSDDDCENSNKGPHYCDMGSHQCWARPKPTGPTDPYCNRSIDTATPANPDGKQWNEGELIHISPQPIPVPPELKPNAQARTLALLKTKPGMTPPLVFDWGDPKPIP